MTSPKAPIKTLRAELAAVTAELDKMRDLERRQQELRREIRKRRRAQPGDGRWMARLSVELTIGGVPVSKGTYIERWQRADGDCEVLQALASRFVPQAGRALRSVVEEATYGGGDEGASDAEPASG